MITKLVKQKCPKTNLPPLHDPYQHNFINQPKSRIHTFVSRKGSKFTDLAPLHDQD